MDVFITNKFWDNVKMSNKRHIHVIMIATKPDIIKQSPLYVELKNKKENVVLIHTGQHYDYNLSMGMLKEFNMEVDINLNIKGVYHKKIAQIIERLGDVFSKMIELNKTPIPYVHGDTMTAMASSCAAWANQIGCVHVEAGIRTLSLKQKFYKQLLNKNISFKSWYKLHHDQVNYEKGQIEPYPEQYNTRATEPASGLYLAPADISKDNLLAEGFRSERIKVVGNTVVDITKQVLKNAKKSNIFEKYPQLKNDFIRFCIHRRENCFSKERFTAIFEAIEILVKKGETVLLISLFATESAIDDFGLRSRLNQLIKHKNFIYSEVWPYYTDVIAAMSKAAVCATDSGSMQEEMNILGVPTVTLRFGTDRPESLFCGGNIIAPPLKGEIIADLILEVKKCDEMKKIKNIYGNNVAKKCVEEVLKIINKGDEMFEFYNYKNL